MKTCLVTTLKGVVNDNTLPKLGIAFGKIKKAGSYNDIQIASGKLVTITLPDNVDLWFGSAKTEKSRTFTGTGNVQYFVLSGDETGVVDCEIAGYWNIMSMSGTLMGMSVKDWSFTSNTTIEAGSSSSPSNRCLSFGNIEDLGNRIDLTSVNFNYSDVTGSVNALADKLFANGKTSGSISVYGSGTSMKKNGASFSVTTIDFTDSGWSF